MVKKITFLQFSSRAETQNLCKNGLKNTYTGSYARGIEFSYKKIYLKKKKICNRELLISTLVYCYVKQLFAFFQTKFWRSIWCFTKKVSCLVDLLLQIENGAKLVGLAVLSSSWTVFGRRFGSLIVLLCTILMRMVASERCPRAGPICRVRGWYCWYGTHVGTTSLGQPLHLSMQEADKPAPYRPSCSHVFHIHEKSALRYSTIAASRWSIPKPYRNQLIINPIFSTKSSLLTLSFTDWLVGGPLIFSSSSSSCWEWEGVAIHEYGTHLDRKHQIISSTLNSWLRGFASIDTTYCKICLCNFAIFKL